MIAWTAKRIWQAKKHKKQLSIDVCYISEPVRGVAVPLHTYLIL